MTSSDVAPRITGRRVEAAAVPSAYRLHNNSTGGATAGTDRGGLT